jgi:glutathione S-transferase
MAQSPQFELISFNICPYVQRSVITLMHKKIDFKLTYIDLENPPEWFKKISPLGKVPVLLVREKGQEKPIVLFESAVIGEYLDEITPPSILPKDPLEKARERAWIEVGSELLVSLYSLTTSTDSSEISNLKTELFEILDRLEEALPGGSTFNGRSFSLVDAAIAPFFVRMLMMKSLRDDSHWKKLPKTRKWADALLALPEVRDSVIPEFKQKYVEYFKAIGSPAANDVA